MIKRYQRYSNRKFHRINLLTLLTVNITWLIFPAEKATDNPVVSISVGFKLTLF